jgi:LuxR family transcriptional regulator, maltose regulon positive regulatory protein
MTDKAAEIIRHYLQLTKKSQLPESLTELERKVVDMIFIGLTSKQIGEKINRSHRTVEDIREKIYNKLKVKNKEQLIAIISKWW